MKSANFCWVGHNIAKSASKVKDDVTNAVMAVFRDATDATERKVSIIELALKDTLNQVSTKIEIKSQTAILRIRADLEREYSKALQNVLTCQIVLHSRMEEVRRCLPDTTDSVAGFDAKIAVVEPSRLRDWSIPSIQRWHGDWRY